MSVIPQAIVSAWPGLVVTPAPYGTGLINLTLKCSLGSRPVILQRVHPAFADSVHIDIESITAHLETRGVLTPRLIRTEHGALSALDDEGRPWRLQTFIEGSFSHDRVESGELANAAGEVVGRYHEALVDLSWSYVHTRPGIHDVGYRSRSLDRAIDAHRGHRLEASVLELRERLEPLRGALLPQTVTRPRHAHGDLKASNVLFDARGRGLCLVDLDTLAHMAWPFELGDAMRSWCNPRREDEPGAGIEVELYRAALAGYRKGARDLELERAEVELLPRGIMTIAAELALRFLCDALEERYFSFDAARFATRGEHNLARATGQIELARSIFGALAELERVTFAEIWQR